MTEQVDDHVPFVEVGLVVAGRLDVPDGKSVSRVQDRLKDQFSEWFPEFRWRLTIVERPEIVTSLSVEPMQLFDAAREERDRFAWDFALILTQAELVSHYKPFAYAAISRAMDAAVISTARIDPLTDDPTADVARRADVLTDRLTVLALHAFGRLNGLDYTSAQRNPMRRIDSLAIVDDLATGCQWSRDQREQLTHTLREVADVRLEERRTPRWALPFYLKSLWINRREVCSAVWQAHPWEFPVRLTKLTTAAVSASVVLIMTSETWQVAWSQTVGHLLSLCLLVMAATTWYVTKRQGLLLHREGRLSEQTVIRNVSAVSVVCLGLLTTFLVLLILVLAVTLLLFRSSVVREWIGTADPLGLPVHLMVGVFISGLCMLVGALGASFEDHHYFRHVTFVDEET